MTENLMDIKQTADYLQMNKMTVYKLAREGKIPAFRVASEWRFKKELIDGWLMNQLKGNHDFEKFQIGNKLEAARKTILVVDDEEVIRDFFKRTLPEYTVVTAASGEEALYIIKNERPDLVLLDIKSGARAGIRSVVLRG